MGEMIKNQLTDNALTEGDREQGGSAQPPNGTSQRGPSSYRSI